MKRIKTLTVFVILSMLMIVLYTVVHILTQSAFSVTFPTQLTVCWYTYWGSEIFICAGLRTVKSFKSDSYYSGNVYDNGMISDSDEALG